MHRLLYLLTREDFVETEFGERSAEKLIIETTGAAEDIVL